MTASSPHAIERPQTADGQLRAELGEADDSYDEAVGYNGQAYTMVSFVVLTRMLRDLSEEQGRRIAGESHDMAGREIALRGHALSRRWAGLDRRSCQGCDFRAIEIVMSKGRPRGFHCGEDFSAGLAVGMATSRSNDREDPPILSASGTACILQHSWPGRHSLSAPGSPLDQAGSLNFVRRKRPHADPKMCR